MRKHAWGCICTSRLPAVSCPLHPASTYSPLALGYASPDPSSLRRTGLLRVFDAWRGFAKPRILCVKASLSFSPPPQHSRRIRWTRGRCRTTATFFSPPAGSDFQPNSPPPLFQLDGYSGPSLPALHAQRYQTPCLQTLRSKDAVYPTCPICIVTPSQPAIYLAMRADRGA